MNALQENTGRWTWCVCSWRYLPAEGRLLLTLMKVITNVITAGNTSHSVIYDHSFKPTHSVFWLEIFIRKSVTPSEWDNSDYRHTSYGVSLAQIPPLTSQCFLLNSTPPTSWNPSQRSRDKCLCQNCQSLLLFILLFLPLLFFKFCNRISNQYRKIHW